MYKKELPEFSTKFKNEKQSSKIYLSNKTKPDKSISKTSLVILGQMLQFSRCLSIRWEIQDGDHQGALTNRQVRKG